MIVPQEVIKWLKENAYAEKDGEFWFVTDFPKDRLPERLIIPLGKRSRLWDMLKAYIEECDKDG